MIHHLKTHPEFFQPIVDDLKTFDMRRTDDRDFEVGDTLVFQEWCPEKRAYTGREARRKVTYILDCGKLNIPDVCVMAIVKEGVV